VHSLIQANFYLASDPARCPHKHDLNMTVPNEFLFPAPTVLVVAVFRCARPSSQPWSREARTSFRPCVAPDA